MNSLNKGQLAQLKVESVAAHREYSCSIPTTDIRYDIIIDIGGRLYRGQIKYCERKHGNNLRLLLDRRNGSKKYTNKEIDILFVYIPNVDIVLAYPPKLFHNKNSIAINLNNPNSKHYYKKYIW